MACGKRRGGGEEIVGMQALFQNLYDEMKNIRMISLFKCKGGLLREPVITQGRAEKDKISFIQHIQVL